MMAQPPLDDEWFAELATSDGAIEAARTLPPLCYTDSSFYIFEQEALFNHEWLCVGRESQVREPGDYFTTRIIGEPILVARNRAGEIKAMSAVCQHRAMLVAEGAGNCRGFTCPYHHWVYSLDGELVNAPAMERTHDFDKQSVRLPCFKVELWQGFIFINFDPEASSLAPRLARVSAAIANYLLESAEGLAPFTGQFPWNWKVMFENNNDGYHASKLHRGPLHDFVPSERAEFPDAEPTDAGFLRYNGTLHPDASFNPTQKAVLPIFPGLTDEDRGRMTFANIPPTLSLVLTCDLVIYLILRPTGAEAMEQDTGVLTAPGANQDPSFEHRLEMIMTSAKKIIAQDMHVDEQVQQGLRSRYAIRGRYSWQEGAQGQFNRWLVSRYRNAWEAMRAAGRSPAQPPSPRLAAAGAAAR